jgi:hypothetical protein
LLFDAHSRVKPAGGNAHLHTVNGKARVDLPPAVSHAPTENTHKSQAVSKRMTLFLFAGFCRWPVESAQSEASWVISISCKSHESKTLSSACLARRPSQRNLELRPKQAAVHTAAVCHRRVFNACRIARAVSLCVPRVRRHRRRFGLSCFRFCCCFALLCLCLASVCLYDRARRSGHLRVHEITFCVAIGKEW